MESAVLVDGVVVDEVDFFLVLTEEALLPLLLKLNFPVPFDNAVPLTNACPLPAAYPFFNRLSDCK